MTADQIAALIPDEVVEVAAIAVSEADDGLCGYDELARAAIAAGLAKWPGAFPHTFRGPLEGDGYVLPLPAKEAGHG